MSHDEALAGLTSPDAGQRLKSARFFARGANDEDRRKLRAALRKETVPWIRRALERSISRTAQPALDAANSKDMSPDPPVQVLASLRAAAIDEVASTIIHELATIIARLRLRARDEVADYRTSDTKTLVDSLAALLAGIRNLKTAAGQPDYSECDLAYECRETCAVFAEEAEMFRFAGPSPFLAEIDTGLFKLALTNVIRNAVEALHSGETGGDPVITLNWGRAGHENWVTVIDNGPGFDGDPSHLIDFGKSTKEEHIGFGLATAKQAMQMMEGDIYPSNSLEGGASVQLRWFSSHEDPIR